MALLFDVTGRKLKKLKWLAGMLCGRPHNLVERWIPDASSAPRRSLTVSPPL